MPFFKDIKRIIRVNKTEKQRIRDLERRYNEAHLSPSQHSSNVSSTLPTHHNHHDGDILNDASIHEISDNDAVSGVFKSKAPTEQEIAIKAAGEEGEKIAEDMLKSFVSHDIIKGYLSTENVCVEGSFFEIDFLVFKENVGLIVVEVKHYSGDISVINDQEIRQVKPSGESKTISNPRKQVQRTGHLLEKLLREFKCKPYPIYNMVLLSHPNATILQQESTEIPIVPIANFYEYLEQLPRSATIKISRTDYDKIVTGISKYTTEYND